MVGLSSKYYYYLEILGMWLLFNCGVLSLLLGIGGAILKSPNNDHIGFPHLHYSGIALGFACLSLCLTCRFGKKGTFYIKLSMVNALFSILIASFGLGQLVDEMVVWSEVPNVGLLGKESDHTAEDSVICTAYNSFIAMQYNRSLTNFILATISIALIFHRLVSAGMIIYDDFASGGAQLLPEDMQEMYANFAFTLDDNNEMQQEEPKGMSSIFSCFKSNKKDKTEPEQVAETGTEQAAEEGAVNEVPEETKTTDEKVPEKTPAEKKTGKKAGKKSEKKADEVPTEPSAEKKEKKKKKAK